MVFSACTVHLYRKLAWVHIEHFYSNIFFIGDLLHCLHVLDWLLVIDYFLFSSQLGCSYIRCIYRLVTQTTCVSILSTYDCSLHSMYVREDGMLVWHAEVMASWMFTHFSLYNVVRNIWYREFPLNLSWSCRPKILYTLF